METFIGSKENLLKKSQSADLTWKFFKDYTYSPLKNGYVATAEYLSHNAYLAYPWNIASICASALLNKITLHSTAHLLWGVAELVKPGLFHDKNSALHYPISKAIAVVSFVIAPIAINYVKDSILANEEHIVSFLSMLVSMGSLYKDNGKVAAAIAILGGILYTRSNADNKDIKSVEEEAFRFISYQKDLIKFKPMKYENDHIDTNVNPELARDSQQYNVENNDF